MLARRFIVATVSLALCALAPPVLGGCGRIGSEFEQTMAGTSLVNGSPATLSVQDQDKIGTANGVGPARYTSIRGDQVQTIQTGSTPRDLFLTKKPDGSIQFNLSSGTTDFGKGIEIDLQAGVVKIAEFGSDAAAPIAAQHRLFELVMQYNAARDEATKQAIVAQIDALKSVIPEVAGRVVEALKKVP